MSDIKRLTDRVNRHRRERDWLQHHKPKDLAIDLSLEAAEVLEHFLWKDNAEVAEYLKKTKNKEAVAEELSDVLYVILALAYDLDIAIPAAFEKKMRLNERKYPVSKARGSKKKYTEL